MNKRDLEERMDWIDSQLLALDAARAEQDKINQNTRKALEAVKSELPIIYGALLGLSVIGIAFAADQLLTIRNARKIIRMMMNEG